MRAPRQKVYFDPQGKSRAGISRASGYAVERYKVGSEPPSYGWRKPADA